jgi:hypothetical protein
MTPKEISRLAGRIFVSNIPPNWAARNQEDQEDYGIDYEIELTTGDDKATGFLFKVQQKGTEHVALTDADTRVAYSGIKTAKLRYYLTQIRLPVVFVVVDVTAETAYWTVLQGDPEVKASFDAAIKAQRETLTLKVPVANRFPATCDRLVEAVSDAMDALLVEDIARLSSRRLVDTALRNSSFDHVAEAIGTHDDMLRCEEIEQLIRQGDTAGALVRARTYFDSGSESVAMRFAAGLNIIRLENGRTERGEVGDRTGHLLAVQRDVSNRLLQLVRRHGAPRYLRFYARFLARKARLRAAIEEDYGLYASALAQQRTGDRFTRHITHVERLRVSRSVLRHFALLQHLLVQMIEAGHFRVVPQAWVQLAMDMAVFLARLRREGLGEGSQHLAAWLDTVGEFSVEIAKTLCNWPDVTICSVQLVAIGDMDDAEDIEARTERAKRFIESIEDPTEKQEGIECLEGFLAISQTPDREPSTEQEIEMYRQIARGLRIDFDNPRNEVDQIVAIGIRDLNPERVLKHCQNLFVSIGFSGLPAQMMGLPTAGGKFLHCTKHGFSVGGMRLDDLDAMFREEHCKGCKDCQPHPDGWTWTRPWQQEQDRKHKRFADIGRSL